MVAEAVKETEVTQPEAEAVTPAEPTTETTPAPEPEVEDSNLDEVLSELGLGDVATAKGTETTPSANETEADPYAGLSPQEIAKKVREDVEAENTAKTSSREYQNYVQGVNRSFQETFTNLDKLADQNMWDADTRQAVKNAFATFNGHWDVLFKHAITQDRDMQREGMKKALVDAATAAGIKDADFESAQDFVTKLAEHAKTGVMSGSEVKALKRSAAEDAVKAYRKRLIDAGVDIPGVRAIEVPNNPGNGGGRIYATTAENDKAFNEGRQTREQWKANDDRLTGKGTK